MSSRLLLDENLRDKALWMAIRGHNQGSPEETIEALRVGDPGAPPRGTDDVDLLKWAVEYHRIIITRDAKTFIDIHAQLLATGVITPGLMLVRDNCTIPDLIVALIIISVYEPPEVLSCWVLWIP